MRTFSTLIIAVVLALAPATAQSPPDAFIAAIEGPQTGRDGELAGLTLTALMQKLSVPGVSIAVIRDFDIHWSRGYGVADVAANTKVEPDTLFQAASISKPVAAMAVLKAVQDGKFTLDQDVNTILTSWRVPAGDHTARQPVTLRGLLSHTSGTDDGFGFPGYKPGAPVPTLVQILDGAPPSNVGRVIVARPPLTAVKYSCGGIPLLPLLMTDPSKRPFDATLCRTVRQPTRIPR